MSYTREELIELLIPGMQRGSNRTVTEIRGYLADVTFSELSEMLSRQRRSGVFQPAVPQRRPVQEDPQPQLSAEVEQAIKSIQALQETEERLLRAKAERAVAFEVFKIQQQQANAPQREAERKQREAKARQLFPEVCRKNRVAQIEANFNILFQADLLNNEYEATQAITSNAVSLVPASPERITAWQEAENAKAVEQYNADLLRLAEKNLDQLRARVRQEAEQTRVGNAQAEADRQLEASRQRDANIGGFPPLPDTWQGRPLDATFIRTCDVATHKLLAKRFGNAQLTARLRGVA